jgi:iron(III) transport system ATP-binding protein
MGVEGFDEPLHVRMGPGPALAQGAEVLLHIDPGDVLIFPSSNGKSS